jgi:hypothetical protein
LSLGKILNSKKVKNKAQGLADLYNRAKLANRQWLEWGKVTPAIIAIMYPCEIVNTIAE